MPYKYLNAFLDQYFKESAPTEEANTVEDNIINILQVYNEYLRVSKKVEYLLESFTQINKEEVDSKTAITLFKSNLPFLSVDREALLLVLKQEYEETLDIKNKLYNLLHKIEVPWTAKEKNELFDFKNTVEIEEKDPVTVPMISVSSSNITSVGYLKNRKELYIKFYSGYIYKYFGVSEETYKELLDASSIGSYFAKNIKSKFKFEKVDR